MQRRRDTETRQQATVVRAGSARLPALALVLLALITACGINSTAVPAPLTTDTPAAAVASETPTVSSACPASVILPDNVEVSLRRNARIEVVKLADATVQVLGEEIALFQGEIVVNAMQTAGGFVDVITPNGFIARLSGRTMIVAYEGAGGQFTLACVDGACKLGANADLLTDVGANSQGTLDQDGTFLGPFAVSLEGLPATCETIFTATPFNTLTPTVDVAATATAACQAFLNQFPLTPTCP